MVQKKESEKGRAHARKKEQQIKSPGKVTVEKLQKDMEKLPPLEPLPQKKPNETIQAKNDIPPKDEAKAEKPVLQKSPVRSEKVKRTIMKTYYVHANALIDLTIGQLIIMCIAMLIAFLAFVFLPFENITFNYIICFVVLFAGIILIIFDIDRKLVLTWYYRQNYDETAYWLKELARRLYERAKEKNIDNIISRFPKTHQEILYEELENLRKGKHSPEIPKDPKIAIVPDRMQLNVSLREFAGAKQADIETPKRSILAKMISHQIDEKTRYITSTNADARRIIKDISLNYERHVASKDLISEEDMKVINKVSNISLNLRHGFRIMILAEFEKNRDDLKKILGIVDRNFSAWIILCQTDNEINYFLPLLTDKGNIIRYDKFAQWIEPKLEQQKTPVKASG